MTVVCTGMFFLVICLVVLPVSTRIIVTKDAMHLSIRVEKAKEGEIVRMKKRKIETESARFLEGLLSYVTYCMHGGRVLTLEFFLILIVTTLARRQSLLAATPTLKY